MSDVAIPTSLKQSLRGRWQVPLFAAGIAIFGSGVIALCSQGGPASFEEQLHKIQELRCAGAMERASAYVVDLLAKPHLPSLQRAELHCQLAGLIHQVETALQRHQTTNVESIIDNFVKARRLGSKLTPDQWAALAETYEWAGQVPDALDAYGKALLGPVARPDRVRRRWIELQPEEEAKASPEVVEAVLAILKDTRSSVTNYFWALEREATRLLDAGDFDAAMELACEGQTRLKGTPEFLSVRYIEALCQRAAGLSAEAEATLRALQEQWSTRDLLWARSGWLLGRLQQEDGRPQEALDSYEQVLRVFRAGEVHNQCAVGRAECMAALERYETALLAFSDLKMMLLTPPPARGIDRSALRTTVTAIGEALVQSGRPTLATEYLQVGLELVNPSNAAMRAEYLSRLSLALLSVARDAQAAAGGKRSDEVRRVYARSAQLELELADILKGDPDAAWAALSRAVANFDDAGDIERMEQVLKRLVIEFPRSPGRSTAMYKLARTHQDHARWDAAIATFDSIIETYANSPDALCSVVPLADCLIARGGDGEARGVSLLLDVVDDRGPDPLFTPQAREYRDALLHLAEYYYRTTDAVVPDHFERAIERLEDALVLYPDDPTMPHCRFMLADSYRNSSMALRQQAVKLESPLARQQAVDEANRRIERSLGVFGEVIEALAPEDESRLSPLEKTILVAAYQYRGDCLFDLGRYAEAIEAYRETAWRFENRPAAITSVMQIVSAHQRLGQREEAQAALARLRWLLKKTPASAFEAEYGMSSKNYWESQVARLEETGIY